jgi:hypothetical protein
MVMGFSEDAQNCGIWRMNGDGSDPKAVIIEKTLLF